MNPTRCISCGEPMAPGADRAPSLGNPNQCVPCCTGHQLPAPGLTGASGEIWPDVGPKVGRLGAVARPAAGQTCSTSPDVGDCARFPAEGSAAYRATDGPTTFGREAAGQQSNHPGSGMVPVDSPSSGSLPAASEFGSSPDASTTLPPATAPAACISRDAGPETTAAGGNSLTSDLYVATPQNADRYTGHTEAAASEVNPFQAGRWTPARIVGADRSDRTITVEVPSASGVVIGDHVALSRGCIKCGAPIDEPWLATVCCADCRAGFRTKAPTRSGVHYMGPSYSPEDCDAWRMLL